MPFSFEHKDEQLRSIREFELSENFRHVPLDSSLGEQHLPRYLLVSQSVFDQFGNLNLPVGKSAIHR
jgi:hypothetical protein